MKRLSLSYLIFLAVPLTAFGTQIQTIIKEARATVGAEAALDNPVTLKISGKIEPADSTLPDARVLMIARKPCSQRLEVHLDDAVETTLLKGCSGCIIRSDVEGAGKRSQFRMMNSEEIQRMRYNTRQLFNFYREDSENDESVRYEGIEQRRGVQCFKLVYSYPDGISTTRYFSVDDKKLVSTITDKGVESVEIGSQVVKGIQFPRRIEYYEKGKLLHTLVLERIEVNKPLRAGIFSIPAVSATR